MNIITRVCSSLLLLSFILLSAWCQTIPEFLQICYRSNTILYPLSMTSLIDIIRKIELTPSSMYSPRTLASMLIHKFSVDGIERDPSAVIYSKGVIPFRISGFQRFRNEILKRALLPADFYYNEHSLTLAEMCTLHFMLSSSVDLWERGDEYVICPKLSQQKQWYTGEMFGTKMSSCPIEMGVVWSSDQAISPSRTIAALLAVLQPVELPVGQWLPNSTREIKYMSSLWASTLAGDLAEMVSMQIGSIPHIGPGGQWNDSVIPTNYFLMTDYNNVANRNWQFTDSELLGGLDGMIMGLEMLRWEKKQNLRLSQILETFYKGGLETSTCQRQEFYTVQIHKRRQKLEEQIKYFANELYDICSTCNYQNEEALETNIKSSYEHFNNYANKLINKPVCPEKPKAWPRIQLNVIFDSTYQPYSKLRFFMMLADQLDVSHYGSRITIINGETGQVITDSLTTSGEIYTHWINTSYYNKDPKYLDISKSVTSLTNLLSARDNRSFWQDILEPAFAHATLIMGTQSTIQNRDLNAFSAVQRNLLATYPEQRIFYLSTPMNVDVFETLGGFRRDRKKNHVIIFDPNKSTEEIDKILTPILSVRRALKPNRCQGKESTITTNYYEVITPHYTYKYIIEPAYLCRSSSTVNIKVLNGENGAVEMCISRQEDSVRHDSCRNATLHQEAKITLYNPCTQWDPTSYAECKPIYLEILGDRSLYNCGDGTCRRPDQIKFTIQLEGLHCVSHNYNCNTGTKHSHLNLFYIITLSYFIHKFINMYRDIPD